MSSTAKVRYITDDVDASMEVFDRLGFDLVRHPAPGFAMMRQGALVLLLNAPGAGGGGSDGDGGDRPRPGGWNRLVVEVEDLEVLMAELAEAGVVVRTGIVQGNGGRQAVVEDSSGNPIELLEPSRD